MKNINRDYLIKIDARTAEITAVPKNLKFFITDVKTSNIFFQLENLVNVWDEFPDGANNYIPNEDASNYTLTLRVVKPNNAHLSIVATPLNQPSFFMADLTEEFIDLVGIYECELFIDTFIDVYRERRTTEPFTYEVKKSVFHNLDEIIDTKVIALEDIATIDYVNGLVTGNVSLDGYATTEQVNTKADKEHVHEDYVTQNQFSETLRGIDCANINLTDFTVSNSISLGRTPLSAIGQYSTATGYETIASGKCSHAEGSNTKAYSYNTHAEGDSTVAGLDSAHAEGSNTISGGHASHSEGYHTIALGDYQHVQGKYNKVDTGTYAHIVGNGTDSRNLSNAHTLDWDGNAWLAGTVKVGADNQELVTKQYVDQLALGGGSYDVDLSNYALKNHTHDEYATKEELNNLNIGGASYDDTELRKLINNKADKVNGYIYGKVSLVGSNDVCTSSIAIGNENSTDYIDAIAIGTGNIASSQYQIVLGTYNKIDNGCPFIVGDG
ncbi:MAG: hypothetical protein IJV71_03015, partial [Lachnospiraceae bacterium]|nr:hypothetical protein [Lachnospiraceae bacterium]